MKGFDFQLLAAGTVLAASVIAWNWGGQGGSAQAGSILPMKQEARHPGVGLTAADVLSPAVVTAAAGKADRLSGCGAETWPNVSSACTGRAVPPARTVTVEYRNAPATSVLVRLPAAAVR
ncbi:hypothetical protein [Propylenella binzhouense]|uniref:Uncharacterized protein n=1 Tax=Propylenella binzhouense TaxID=2555902 RepID=A0A964T4U2_9HYPH|nr:hypothetical protein [Propylenella binzhouense]MYZ48526.1 hypothetical protein [Propylenella binzhouense]